MESKKIINWVKENHILISILLIALIIRIYFYIQLGNQPQWWDESEYLNMARAWAFNIPYQFHPVRPVLFSLITAGLFKVFEGEFLPRAFVFAISMLSIYAMYLFGKETFNKNVGLVAAFLMAVNYLNLFYTFRLLADIPTLTFFTLSAYYFWKYFKSGHPGAIYMAAIMTGIGTLFKLPVAAILFVVLIYLLITEKLKFLKRKEIWIAGIIFCLILAPYIIWGYFQFDGFVISQAGAYNMAEETGFDYIKSTFQNIIGYFKLFPIYFSIGMTIAFVGGILMMRRVFYGWDILFNGKETDTRKELKRNLFLILAFIIPFITVSLSLGYVDSRLLLVIFPTVFIIAGFFVIKIYDLLRGDGTDQVKKAVAIIFILAMLCIPAYSLKQTNEILIGKSHSYEQVKWAGEWLESNTLPGEAVVSTSTTQIRYYSKRETFDFVETEEEFEQLLKDNPQIKYYMLSIFEKHRDEPWMYEYPQKHELEVLQMYASGEQPILGIYKLK